ncbi:MAG TPA: hypothetical protein VGR70_08620 [Stellaceae bacterium]|nr:hypothetical protein [Stellaceae bacterium]
MSNNVVAAAIIAAVLGGCSLMPNEKLAPQPGADQVEMTKEQGGKFLAFVGPKLLHTEAFLGVDETNYFCLRSWLDTRNGEVAHQVYVEDSYYGAPYRWDGAHDADNKNLRFIAISRNEISCDQGCSYADEFAAALPEDLLRAHRDSGLTVTFTAQTGKTLTVNVPGRFIAEQLTAVDATRAALAANAKAAQAAAPTPTPTPAAPAAEPAPAPAAAPATSAPPK